MTAVLLAVPGVPGEPELVRQAAAHRMHVVRRCVDAVDLLAAAATDESATVIVSAALPRLAPDVVERVAAGGRRVIGLAVDDPAMARLRTLGVERIVTVGPTPEATVRLLADACREVAVPVGVWPTVTHEHAAGLLRPDADDPLDGGRLIGVWGPMGSPGRTTVAIGVAEAIAATGRRVLLVDADTYAPSVSMTLGVVDDASGLIVACRRADDGSLTAAALTSAARRLSGTLHLLTGLADVDRWPELRPGALGRVWATCRAAFDVTVVDAGFCLERDDEASAWARARNAATVTALGCADHVLAVAQASGPGAVRLASAWPALRDVVGDAPVTVVRNRSDDRGRGWLGAVRSAGVDAPSRPIPPDVRSLDRCWRQGRSLAEGAPRSRVRRALGELAALAMSG